MGATRRGRQTLDHLSVPGEQPYRLLIQRADRQYGPQATWDARSSVITNEIRTRHLEELAERLAADELARRQERELERRRLGDLRKVQELEARQKAETERKAAEATAAKEAKLLNSRKGKEKAPPLSSKPTKANTKQHSSGSHVKPNGFKTPLPKPRKSSASVPPNTLIPAGSAKVSLPLPTPQAADSVRPEDVLVPPTPPRHRKEPQRSGGATSSSTKERRHRGADVLPTSSFDPRAPERKKPVSTHRPRNMVPPTPYPPQAGPSRLPSGSREADVRPYEPDDYVSFSPLHREQTKRPPYSSDRRNRHPMVGATRRGPSHIPNEKGRLRHRSSSPPLQDGRDRDRYDPGSSSHSHRDRLSR